MSKYRVMFLLSKRDNLEDLYKYDTTEIDGQVLYREFDTVEEVDAYVETLLNDQNYSKDEILVVREREFTVNVEYDDANTGEPGTTPGKDGFSPIAKVTQTETGAIISITDKSGTTTATVTNGKDGKDGVNGTDGIDGTLGQDGYSPVISENSGNNADTYKLDITTKTGQITTPNLKGEKGEKGDNGQDGAPGAQGDKGDSGATWLFGGIEPTTEGSNGDFYLNTSSYDIYNKENGVWNKKGNIKGATGEKGADGTNGTDGQDGAPGTPGVSAGFGTPTATVDANIGTPSVTITASGEDTAKVFNFEFKNLKGEKGDKGEPGTPGTNGQDGAPGENGADGTNGLSVTAITLTKDSTGAIVSGEATMSDQSKVTITINTIETT